jgi:ABC-type nitrate/sulfonate/bicarbonate transport system permease component
VNLGGLLVPIAAIAMWQLLKSTMLLGYEYLPAPSEVLAAFDHGSALGVDDRHRVFAVADINHAVVRAYRDAIGLAAYCDRARP